MDNYGSYQITNLLNAGNWPKEQGKSIAGRFSVEKEKGTKEISDMTIEIAGWTLITYNLYLLESCRKNPKSPSTRRLGCFTRQSEANSRKIRRGFLLSKGELSVLTLCSSPFRSHLERLLDSASLELLVASPYIKTREAEWVCSRLAKQGHDKTVRLQLLTDVRSSNVLGGSLDMAALRILQSGLSRCDIINLPRLHAKVYVADEASAVITSANLTPSGLDSNLEYGVGITDAPTIRNVRRDLQLYATLGNSLSVQTIVDLEKVSDDLRLEFQAIEKSAEKKLRQKFNETLRKADQQFLRAQVGARSAHGLFADAMIYLLSKRPMGTRELHRKLKELLPDLCDDSTELVINGQAFGKKWKHVVRNAQVFLRRKGSIKLIGKEWHVKVS